MKIHYEKLAKVSFWISTFLFMLILFMAALYVMRSVPPYVTNASYVNPDPFTINNLPIAIEISIVLMVLLSSYIYIVPKIKIRKRK